jgi:hypothetical protein
MARYDQVARGRVPSAPWNEMPTNIPAVKKEQLYSPPMPKAEARGIFGDMNHAPSFTSPVSRSSNMSTPNASVSGGINLQLASPALKSLLKSDKDLKTWLELTGYFDITKRGAIIHCFSQLKKLDKKREMIMEDIKAKHGFAFDGFAFHDPAVMKRREAKFARAVKRAMKQFESYKGTDSNETTIPAIPAPTLTTTTIPAVGGFNRPMGATGGNNTAQESAGYYYGELPSRDAEPPQQRGSLGHNHASAFAESQEASMQSAKFGGPAFPPYNMEHNGISKMLAKGPYPAPAAQGHIKPKTKYQETSPPIYAIEPLRNPYAKRCVHSPNYRGQN